MIVFQHLFPFVRQKEHEMGGTMFPREQIDGTVQLLFDVRIPPIGKGECLDGTGVGDGLQLMDTAVFLASVSWEGGGKETYREV